MMTYEHAVFIGLADIYLCGYLDPFITSSEVRILMYFLQETDEPLIMEKMEMLYDMYLGNDCNPYKPLILIPGLIKQSRIYMESNPKTGKNIKEVEKLIDGFETPTGLKLLASVYKVSKEKAYALDEIIQKVNSTNEYEKTFSERQIEIAFDWLVLKGWINRSDKRDLEIVNGQETVT